MERLFINLTIFLLQGRFFDIEFDFKGDPLSGHITYCKYITHTPSFICQI